MPRMNEVQVHFLISLHGFTYKGQATKETRKMVTNQVMILLLLMPVFYYHAMATASSGRLPLTALPLVELEHRNEEAKAEVKHLSNNENGETVIAHHGRKLQYAAGTGSRGVNGGEPNGNGGGGSNTPYTQGGAAVIPVYGAGAGANIHRNNHHSAGSCIHSCRRFPALSAILLAYLLRNMYMFVY